MGNTSSTRLGDTFQNAHNASGLAEVQVNATSPRAWLQHIGARNALVHAADQGNLSLLKLICEGAEGRTFHGVNDGASKGLAPLMRACTHGSARHTECVTYLLVHGADVYAQNSRGDNAMHIAAKHGNAGSLHVLLSFRPHADGEDGSQLLGDIIVQGDAGPTRFIDLHNGSGVTALHLAALKGSHTAIRELLRAGASADAVTLSGVHNPQLSRGSTALHIAASRGHAGCVAAILEHQAGIPGMELQRLRNARGLKPSQLARLAGHHSVARLLSEVNISGAHQHTTAAAPSSSGAPAAELPRRVARAGLPARTALPARQETARMPAASPERGGMSQENLLAALTQRARLLLSLRATTQSIDSKQQDSNTDSSEEAALAAVSAEVAAALRSKGAGGAPADSANTLMGLLSSLAEPSSTAIAHYTTSNGHSASASQRSSVDKGAHEANAKGEDSQSRQQAKEAKSYAAGALVQAALNAMAVTAPRNEVPISSGFLAPASPVAAVIAVQAALKKLANQRIGSRLVTVPAHQLPSARVGAASGAAAPNLHRAVSGASLRSTASTAGVLNGSGARGRWRRRHNALRLSLSGNLARHGAASEAADSAGVAGHVASRRRRHRRNGSFGSLGYPAALSALSPRNAASRSILAAAGASEEPFDQHDAPESSAASCSKPGSSLEFGDSASGRLEAALLQTDAGGEPDQHQSLRPSFEREDRAHARDSTATELPEEWVTALHSMDSSGKTSQPNIGSSPLAGASSEHGTQVDNVGELDPHMPAGSASQAGPSESRSNLSQSPHSLRHRGDEKTGLLGEELEPLLPSDAQCNIRASSSRGDITHTEQSCDQLQVRSRLFSTSEDAPMGTHPQVFASSPTNVFDTAEILGSDSIPSSPFGDSTADDWLHVHEGLLESDNVHHAWPNEDLLVRGSFLQGSDITYTHTEGSESMESRDLQWQSALSQDYVMPEDLYDTIPIEAIVPNQESTLLRSMRPMPTEAPLEVDENLQTCRLPSLPLPGTAAAQVAEAFGRRTTFYRPPPRYPAGSQSLPATPREPISSPAAAVSTTRSFTEGQIEPPSAVTPSLSESHEQRAIIGATQDHYVMETQVSAAPSPGAAAAEVRRAFAKIATSGGSSSANMSSARSGQGADVFVSTSAGHAEQPSHSLVKSVSQTVTPAARQESEPACQAAFQSELFAEQHTEKFLDSVDVQKEADADSSIREAQRQASTPLARAVSLKGAAAAHTAHAFSRLRGRASTSTAALQQPVPEGNSQDSADSQSAAVAVQSSDMGPHPEHQQQQPEMNSKQSESSAGGVVYDLWGQHSVSTSPASVIDLIQGLPEQDAAEPVIDLFRERPAGQLGRPIRTAGSGSSLSRSEAAALQPSSSQMAGASEDPEGPDSPDMPAPQSAFYHDTAERAEDGESAQGRIHSPMQTQGSETKSAAKWPLSRVDPKGLSPRKRATTLGRKLSGRLSGMLPGVKGKERAKPPSPRQEMCTICMDSALEVSISSCQHGLCRQCAYQLCARGLAAPLCPFCRGIIQHFEAIRAQST